MVVVRLPKISGALSPYVGACDIPNSLNKSLNNKFNLVLHVFWCVVGMATTVAIPYKKIHPLNTISIPLSYITH